jgi:hypothetical protein
LPFKYANLQRYAEDGTMTFNFLKDREAGPPVHVDWPIISLHLLDWPIISLDSIDWPIISLHLLDQLYSPAAAEVAPHVVALQVAFERQTLKPVFRLICYRLWV